LKSFENAESGDSVLLAPACASFDMFRSFEERGVVFKNAVQNLKSKVEGQPAEPTRTLEIGL